MEEHELTAGLEVHQQLNTNKLFCSCPSNIRDDPADFSVRRTLRASAGESGETDVAAAAEQRKQKQYLYEGYSDTTCLVELDEEPVAKLNSQAVTLALQVAKLLNLTIMDEIHVMRKTVVDGSNTSGFQRTALVGLNGYIDVEAKRIRIEQLCLEEDSAKIIERTDEQDTYNLSRLGIPLLEITTGPDLHSPAQVRSVAAHIGMLLRSTEQVKRGLGTIRQDVNVSVPGGSRVEIKGAQDLDMLATLVENEAMRQRTLINLAQVIPRQEYAPVDVTQAFRDLTKGFIAKALSSGSKAIAVKLAGWNDNLATELMPTVRLGKELAGYAKAAGFGGLIHASEDFSKYGFSNEPARIRELAHCDVDDAWIIIIGSPERIINFLEYTFIPRLEQLSVGVPSEVRKAEMDGTTSFLRPMPGAARMYPETDVRPVTPDVQSITLPELWSQKTTRLSQQYGISADLAGQLVREGVGSVFEKWVHTYSRVPPSTIASLLASKEREIKTRHNISVDIIEHAPTVLEKLQSGTIMYSSVEEILILLAKAEPIEWESYAPVDEQEVKRVCEQLVKENPGAPLGLLMGKVMRHFNNKVDGKQVNEFLRELIAG